MSWITFNAIDAEVVWERIFPRLENMDASAVLLA